MRKQLCFTLLFAVPILFFSLSWRKASPGKEVQKEFSRTVNTRSNLNLPPIHVSNITQLYTAINNPANAGRLIVLAKGSYFLDPTAQNKGRLEFQKDMQLQGETGNPNKVIIDESRLLPSSFSDPSAPRTGGIRMGRGTNSIEWMTILGNASTNALSAIDTDLPSPGIINVRLSHLIVKGSQTGIDIRNPGFAGPKRIIEAEIDHNELTGNTVGGGQGITIQNANGSTESIIRATLEENNVHGNKVGLRSWNLATNFGSITINSNHDRFDGNGIAFIIIAGATNTPTTAATGNFICFNAQKTSFRNNDRTKLPPGLTPDPSLPPAGFFAAGAFGVKASTSSANRLELNLWDNQVSGNQHPDINAFGAFSSDLFTPAGINNAVEITLFGMSTTIIPATTASSPVEPPPGTNIINIF